MFRFQEPTVNPPEQKMDIFRRKDIQAVLLLIILNIVGIRRNFQGGEAIKVFP